MIQEQVFKYKEYLRARGRSLSYAERTSVWLTYLETKKLEVFTQETLTEFFNETKYATKTRNLFISAGRDYYTGFLGVSKEQNEWFKIKLLKTEYRIPDFLTQEEIEEAKRALKTYNCDIYSIPKIEALIDFLFATGTRKAELLNLKRTDFDMKNCRVKLFGKGKKERFVYFNNKVKKEIELYFTTEPEQINAFNITLMKLHYMVKLLSKYLGKKVYMHLFRHSGARNMLMKDVPLLFVSKILGHSSIQSTMRYTDPNEEMISQKYKEKMK